MLKTSGLVLLVLLFDMVGSIVPTLLVILIAYFWKRPPNYALPGLKILKISIATWVLVYVTTLLVYLSLASANMPQESQSSISLVSALIVGVWFARSRISGARKKNTQIGA